MRITDIQIDGFGIWSDVKLGHLSEGLTVFYGPNEAGKTTLMQFVRSVLYGFSADRRLRYLPPASGGRSGGGLGVIGAGGRFELRRRPGNGLSADDLGKLEVLSSGGARQGHHVLGSLLSGIDEPIFTNVFAVGLRELQELATLNDTEAATQLYKLTSGMDRVSLVDVMRELAARRNSLVAPEEGNCVLAGLLERRERLQETITELSAAGNRWMQLSANRNELHDEVLRLEDSIQRMEREARAVEVAMQVRGDWFRREDVCRRLEKLGPPKELPENAVAQLDELNARIAEHREQVEAIRRQRRMIVDEANAQPINRELAANSCRVEAVCEHGPWISSLEGQVHRLEDEIEELDAELRGRWEKLGLSPEETAGFTPDVSQRAMSVLRGPARGVAEALDRLKDAKAERDDARREADEVHEQLQLELVETGETELDAALEAAGNRVKKLRQRVKLQDRLEKLDRERKEIDEDRRALLEEQILPVSKLVWCGVPFVVGSVMVMSGVFWPNVAALGWNVIALGTVGIIVGVVMKLWLERTANQELDACERQLDRVKKKIRDLKQERDDLDADLPKGGGPLDARVTAAEEYVKKLEDLTPLESQRATALTRAETAKEKAAAAGETLKEARAKWRDALRSVGLPETFSPEHIQQLTDDSDQTLQLVRRLETRREELAERKSELAALTERIDNVLTQVNLSSGTDDPKTRIRQLSSAMGEQQQWMSRRRELLDQHRELRRRFREHSKQLRQFAKQRRVLINRASAEDEAHLRKLAATQAKIETLTAQLADLNERIKIAIGSQCSEQAVADVLKTHGDDKLEQYWDRLLGRLQDSQSRLSQLHEHRGEMVQEMKSLAEDRRLSEAKLELGCVEEKICVAVRRWHVLSTASIMLEEIRQIYETERQPETLADASKYLARLTQGRYHRIWTPLSEENLRVDNADGDSLPLDVLSTGTREAVFISLRLALVAAYARRGALLPLVLDDVLVNFDNTRATAAAEVLRDFAATGHQMLLFTCHRHIMRIFESIGAEVRVLPGRDGLLEADEADELIVEPPEPKFLEVAEEEMPEEEVIEMEEDEEEVEEEIEEEVEEEIEEEIEEEEPVAEYEEEDEESEEEAYEEEEADEEDEEFVAEDEPEEEFAETEAVSWIWTDEELRLADDPGREDLLSILAGNRRRDTTAADELWWETETSDEAFV